MTVDEIRDRLVIMQSNFQRASQDAKRVAKRSNHSEEIAEMKAESDAMNIAAHEILKLIEDIDNA